MRRSPRRATTASLVLAVLVGTFVGPALGAGTSQGAAAASGISITARTDAGDRGRWTVEAAGPDAWLLTWRSPTPLPITSARPEFLLGGEPLAPPGLDADGRTLSLVVSARTAPSVTDLDVRLSGRLLDERSAPRERVGTAIDVPPAGRPLAVDPGERGPYTVVRGNYRLSDLTIPGFDAPVERVGHVERPADLPESAGPAPLVLFLHGRHDYCYGEPTDTEPGPDWPCRAGTRPVPSQLGYRYVQRLLASQGYVTVSIAANGINAQDWAAADGGALARAQLVESHLDQWAAWAADGTYDVDLSRVVLVGHSRGGEGVNEASLSVPLDAPYRIVGQLLLAPTDFGRTVAAYVPTVVVLPYCDGDVFDLQGQAYTDRARDLARGDTALRSSVLVMGANHNFFNTEWTPALSRAPSFDDAPGYGVCRRGSETRLTAPEQRAVARTWIAGAVALMAGGDDRVLPMFDGSDVEVASAGGADVRTHALGLGRSLRRPGVDGSTVVGEPGSRICAGRVGSRDPDLCSDLGAVAPHWTPTGPYYRHVPTSPAWQVTWAAAGISGGLAFDRPWDLSGADALDLRTVVDPETGPVRVDVRLWDGSGASATIRPRGGGHLARLPGRIWATKLWAQTLRVRLHTVTGIDLTDVRQVDLVGTSDDGSVWVLDLAAVGSPVPPVPERRLPTIVVDELRVPEGDVDGTTTVDVPFRVVGDLTRRARFSFVALDPYEYGDVQGGSVVVPAGATGGTIPVEYLSDRRDDLRLRQLAVSLFARTQAMPAPSTSSVFVIDDDPRPVVTVRPERRTVAEGDAIRWVVRRSAPADYYAGIRARVVDVGKARPLTIDDLPAWWVDRHVFRVPAPGTPLYEVPLRFYGLLRPGRVEAAITLPLRRDGVEEGVETVSLRVRVQKAGEPVVRTVRVTDG